MFKNLIYTFLLLVISSSFSVAQSNNSKINTLEDSLSVVGKAIFSRISEPERIQKNFQFVKSLVHLLKEKNSFGYPLKKLSMISILNSPDNNFRIFSWNVPLDDGSYLYYGSIQIKTNDGSLKLYPLLDKTFEFKDPQSEISQPSFWYGAQYYAIQKLSNNTYLLLGWKGHHADYSQKVIEILTIGANNNISLGKNIFTEDLKLARKIFSYTRQASMYLQYNNQLKRIEFDHLVPADPKLKSNYKYYGPDLSYDAYRIEDGRLIFQSNIEVLNPVRGDEDRFLSPNRKDIKKDSGF